jgi:peptidoglycan biosynthesis protein MviN/MurJ (putative lipid II flippase)
VVINVVVSVATVDSLGLAGLALGIALGAWVECLLLVVLLGRRLPIVEVRRELAAWAAFGLCAVAAGAATWLAMLGLEVVVGADPGKVLLAVETVLAGMAGVAAYLALGWALRFAELPQLLSIGRRALGREPAA